MIPKIDLLKWRDMGLDIDQMAELVELFEEAKKENLRINTLIAQVYNIMGYYNKTAQIFNVSPATVSRRVKDRAGIFDRVLSGVINPFVIEAVMQRLGMYQKTIDGVVAICADSPVRYSNYDRLRELLDAFYVADAKQKVIIGKALNNLR